MKKASKSNIVSITTPTSIKQTAEQRFVKNVAKPDKNGCELWTGSKFRNGYGQFWDDGNQYCHRYAWAYHNGREIPEGKYVLHSCHNRACTAKSHLRVGSAAENSAEMVEAGRSIKGRTVTKRKMTDSEKNLIVDLYLAGESQYAIAKELGRTEQVISYHIRKHKGLIASKLRAKAEDVSNACKELSDAISNVLAEAA